jgi:pimeloyl-ACP methyl ester carboxylesterase
LTAYTLGNVARICKVKPARLRYWERTSLLRPAGESDDPGFEFGDIITVRTVLDLLQRGVPLRRIRKSAEDLQSLVPELDHPLGALREWVEGSGRVVVRHDGVLVQPNGQTVLDFDVVSPEDESLATLSELSGRRTGAIANQQALARQNALDWFERGCKLDSDRATYADAIESYHCALEADPDFADAHCNLGSVYFNQDRRATARGCFERAIEIEPLHVEANLNLASLLEEEGRNKIGAFMRSGFNGFDTLEDAADTIAAYVPHRPRPSDLSGLKKNLRQRGDGRWYWHWDPRFITNREGVDGQDGLVNHERLCVAAARISIPTMLVRGRMSDIVSDESVRELQELVPHAEVVDVAGAGHMVAGDKNDVFNSAVIEFVNRNG